VVFHFPVFTSRKKWLEKEGSPKSRIDRVVFQNYKIVASYTFSSFEVRK